MTEDFLTIYNDPGEDYGWCVGCGLTLLSAGTNKMWTQVDEVLAACRDGIRDTYLLDDDHIRDGIDGETYRDLPVGRLVSEDFRIYPWAAKQLAWDRVRTARAIGGLQLIGRMFEIPLILQPAAIKKAAQNAGAEELYYRPLHENRHQNDSIQHFVFYTNTEILGLKMPVPAVSKDDE